VPQFIKTFATLNNYIILQFEENLPPHQQLTQTPKEIYGLLFDLKLPEKVFVQ
jgi:hypothetical protein